MRKACIFIIVLALTFVQIARAEESTNRKLAEELLSLMDVQKNIEQTFEAVKQMQMSQIKSMNLPDGDTDKAQARQEQIMDLITKEMGWDKIKDDYISIYADTFTEEELKGLIEFYKGPVGQKLIEKGPELIRRSMQISQKQMADLMPKIQEITKKWVEEQKATQDKTTQDD